MTDDMAAESGNTHSLLQVAELKKHFIRTRGFLKRAIGSVKAVDGVSFSVREGETLALVESGCGKTTTGRCIIRAVEPTSGAVYYRLQEGGSALDITQLDKEELRELWKQIGLIFQDPYSSLNPRMTIRESVGESFITFGITKSRQELDSRVGRLLSMVQLDPAYMVRYPHAFSGGQRQRVAIARALSMSPRFVVADEPVSALDVSVQAQILNLMVELQEELHLTCLFIAHNLAVVEYVSDRIAVMYVGKIVELADTDVLFRAPQHPYTEALLSAVPKPDPKFVKKEIVLGSEVADPANPPAGCYFHPRCRYAEDICRKQEPELIDVAKDGASPHYVKCHFAEELQLAGMEA